MMQILLLFTFIYLLQITIKFNLQHLREKINIIRVIRQGRTSSITNQINKNLRISAISARKNKKSASIRDICEKK